MSSIYQIDHTENICTPALIFFKDLIQKNIQRCIEMVGSPERLRPHVKTHKTREVAQMELEAGITKHKCATIAEAEMLAQCGAPSIFLSYNLVGPNCQRMAKLIKAYPESEFLGQVDHPVATEALSKALEAEGVTLEVLLDLDVGQHRTGIAPGPEAVALYRKVQELPGLKPGGLHVYDGHNHQSSGEDRQKAVDSLMEQVLSLRKKLEENGMSVPRIVAGGTPTFPMYAKMEIADMECSPGTCFLHDTGYGSRFQDLEGFTPAALLMTRVISKPTANRVTLDLGYKAVASDPPAGKRCTFVDLDHYEAVLQNEEHLVLELPEASRLSPGDELLAIPTHICPTCALHRSAYVVEKGRLIGQWDIVARDRALSI